MPIFKKGDKEIYFEESGSGYPLLILAPGALRSRASNWGSSSNPKYAATGVPWMDPRKDLSSQFRVIAMDQRNAGQSRTPLLPTDSFMSYLQDHLDLLDYLGVKRAHFMGGCIGCSLTLNMAKNAPERISAGVLQQPIGLIDTNRPHFNESYAEWKKEMMAKRPEVPAETFDSIQKNMYSGDFVFTVNREWMHSCPIPVFVMPGNDMAHPTQIGEELAALAPNGTLHRDWKGLENRAETIRLVTDFLLKYTPTDQRRAA